MSFPSSFSLIDTVYAAPEDGLSPQEEQCINTYGSSFSNTVGNQCFCKEAGSNDDSILCSTFVANKQKESSSEMCQKVYGDLFVAQSVEKACLCSSPTPQQDPIACSEIPQDLLNQKFCSQGDKTLRDRNTAQCICMHGLTDDGKECLANNYGDVGLKCSAQDILHNTCTWNINKTLGIKGSNPIPNPELYIQDLVLAATSFVGTGLFIGIIVLGFKAVVYGGSGSEDQMGNIKSGLKYLLIGFALIVLSYTIIRIVQYVARGY